MMMTGHFSAIKVDSVNYQGVDLPRLYSLESCSRTSKKILKKLQKKLKKVTNWILKVATLISRFSSSINVHWKLYFSFFTINANIDQEK